MRWQFDNIEFDDFLLCQRVAELLTAYQIDPTRVRVLFYTCTSDDGRGEYGTIAIRSRQNNTQVELDSLRRLHTDLGIDDSETEKSFLLYTTYDEIYAKLNHLIEAQSLKRCVAQLSQQAKQ